MQHRGKPECAKLLKFEMHPSGGQVQLFRNLDEAAHSGSMQ